MDQIGGAEAQILSFPRFSVDFLQFCGSGPAVSWVRLGSEAQILSFSMILPGFPAVLCGSDRGSEAQILSFPRFSLVLLQFCGSGPAGSWVGSGVRGSDPQFSIIFVCFPAVLCRSDRGSEAQIHIFLCFSLVFLQLCGSGPAVSWVRSDSEGQNLHTSRRFLPFVPA